MRISHSMALLLLLLIHSTAALQCNITLTSVQLEVESVSLCNYVNYHVFMLLVFGPATAGLFMACVCIFICGGFSVTDGLDQCCKVTLMCFFLSFGLESWLAFVYLLCIVFRVDLQSRSNAVVDRAVVALDDIFIATDSTDYSDIVCPICLQTGGRRWYMTKCCHQFHTDCIGQWKERTCPLCRAATVGK